MPRAETTATQTEAGLRQSKAFITLVYINAFVSGTVIMSFEMLGSRYLNPYFGSGIYTWAALIATVLIALMVGYFFGGWLADKRPSHRTLALLIILSSIYLAFVPVTAEPILAVIFDLVESEKTGSLMAAIALLFVPLTLLGVYSPFAIRLTLMSTERSGTIAGRIYGISTFGSVFGTLVTTFYLIPTLGSRSITYLLAAIAAVSGLTFLALVPRTASRIKAAASASSVIIGLSLVASTDAAADEFAVFERYNAGNGERRLIESLESEYNNIFITQQGDFVTMSFRVRRRDETESVLNLRDIKALPLPYTRAMTVGLVYADQLRSMLMIGLGGGTTSRYVGRAVPTMQITVAELDEGVVRMARKHFGVKENERYKVVTRDGRVYLLRNRKARYDLIMVDAFRGGYVPFHLLTREFYGLLKRRLEPGGAAIFNVHGGTKLFQSTMRTLKDVFGHVETIHAAGSYITIVRNGPPLPLADAKKRAAARQAAFKTRYDLTEILKEGRVTVTVNERAQVLTDDFAPVNLYESIREKNKKR